MFGGILCGRPPCEAPRCLNSIAVTKKVNLPKILCLLDRKKTQEMDSPNTKSDERKDIHLAYLFGLSIWITLLSVIVRLA